MSYSAKPFVRLKFSLYDSVFGFYYDSVDLANFVLLVR